MFWCFFFVDLKQVSVNWALAIPQIVHRSHILVGYRRWQSYLKKNLNLKRFAVLEIFENGSIKLQLHWIWTPSTKVLQQPSLHKKWSFPLRISSAGHIYLKILNGKLHSWCSVGVIYIVIFPQKKVFKDFDSNVMVVFPIFWK